MAYTMSLKAINQRAKTIKKAQAASLIVNSLKKEKINDIIQMRIEGLSYESISYLLKLNRATVTKYCKQKGL
jgi:DNA invertase Pin-like site-specific DNA recombinase